MKENVNKMPYISNNNDYIFVNYSNSNNNINYTFLELIDLETLRHIKVDKRQCSMKDNGLSIGEMIVYCGGLENILYYQVIELNNEVIETGGESTIYKYTIEDGKLQKAKSLKNKVQYVTGDKDNIFVSDYSYEIANADTGKIYKLEDQSGSFQQIPKITPGADIMGSHKLENGNTILFSSINFYIFNSNNETYLFEKYKKSSYAKYSSIQFYKNSFGYIESREGGLYFYRINT